MQSSHPGRAILGKVVIEAVTTITLDYFFAERLTGGESDPPSAAITSNPHRAVVFDPVPTRSGALAHKIPPVCTLYCKDTLIVPYQPYTDNPLYKNK